MPRAKLRTREGWRALDRIGLLGAALLALVVVLVWPRASTTHPLKTWVEARVETMRGSESQVADGGTQGPIGPAETVAQADQTKAVADRGDDEVARQAEARRAEEEAARLAEAERAEEEAARLAAAKRAEEEAARLAEAKRAEEEAARLAAAKRAEEEAARLAEAKRAEEEAARLAAAKRAEEEAARLAAAKRAEEEAARLAAAKRAEEEAARLAAAKRAEEEAARLAAAKRAEEEAARLAAAKRAEEEAARLAAAKRAEEEAARLAAAKRAEEEAARLAAAKRAEEEAARLAAAKRAEEEAARLAAAGKSEAPLAMLTPGTAAGDSGAGSAPRTPESSAPLVARIDCADLDLGVDVRFGAGNAGLDDRQLAILRGIARCVRRGGAALEIGGHTDARGDSLGNLLLSVERAEQVADLLRGLGIDADRLSPRGYGESQPRADNFTADGRARNRRVTIRRIAG